MTIWIVWREEMFTYNSVIVKIFRNEKDAEAYCHKLIDNGDGYSEYSLSKEYVEE